METNEYVNYTDHTFQQLCNQSYGVNRGVYNQIDKWFYNKGIKSVVYRRKIILRFLEFIFRHRKLNKTKIKFGKGGLTVALEQFWLIERNTMVETY